ncbi:MAG: hypothetical protein IKE55_06900 [Kiritimatiellae bacterium]|nr:hypothetical protein [Kiritimatiellia bacterium]
MQTSSSFPDVTTYFGTDGSTVGTSVAARHEWNMNGVTLTFPHVTVFSSYFRVNNNASIAKFLGDWTLVKTSQSIEFGGINIQNNDTRGVELAGTFSSASDVEVFLSGTFANNSTSYGICPVTMSGDFSAFKGRFTCREPIKAAVPYSNGPRRLRLDLTSASAMGDASYARADAYTLAGDTHLTISPAVVQSSARGITLSLSSGQTVYLNADADWTLTTPLCGGSAGTLVKEGAGKLTMNCQTELRNIVVTNGTLELGADFTFADGATVTVKSGAMLQTSFPAGLNIVLEDGAQYGLSPIPYNPVTDETQPAALTAAQAWEGRLAVSLSDDISLPFSVEKRLALITMPTSAKVLTPADFSGARSRDEGLPVTHFEVATDGNGMQTVYLVARPVIYATDPDQNNKNILTETISRMDGDSEVFMWSDHLKAHGGADYVLGNGAYVASWTGWDGMRVFPGESLEMSNGSRLMLRSKLMVFTNLVMRGGTRLTTAGCGGYDTPHRIGGRVRFIDSNRSNPVQFVGNYDLSAPRWTTYDIEAEVVGDGWLQFGGQPKTNFTITSTNSSYKGGWSLGVGETSDKPVAIRFSHPEAFGGPLDAFKCDAISPRSLNTGIMPLKSMTYAVANRGLYFEEYGGFVDTPDGVEFAFLNEVRLRRGLNKKGGGTLTLGGAVQFGSNTSASSTGDGTSNKFNIDAGYLKAVNTNSYAKLILTFADGAGIAVDAVPTDPDVAEFGLFAPEEGMFAANGTINVRLDGAAAQLANGATVRVPVCTVAGGTADLSNVLVGVRLKGYACKIEKEVLASGLVRYSAFFVPQGMRIVVR